MADDPTTWFPVGGADTKQKPATKATQGDDPTTWFQVGGDDNKTAALPDKGGMARNVAAGVLEGVGGTGNALLAGPSGAIGKLPATAIVFLHDALAPVFGYERFPDKARNMLLGNEMDLQPGTAAIDFIGQHTPGPAVKPSDVVPATEAEKYARVGATGATMGAMMSPAGISPLLAATMGAAGGVGGSAGAAQLPPWMQPMGEIVIGGAAGGAAGAAAMGANVLKQGVNNFVSRPTRAELVERNVQTAMNRTPAPADSPGVPPGGAGSPPGMGGGGAGPLPAGAQVSPTSVVGISPEQEAIYRSTAEGQKWLEPQPVNVPDRNAYVRGVNPNMAEQEQTVATARELKSLGITSTEVSQEAKQIAQDHNEARSQHFSEVSGTGHDLAARARQRQDDIEKAKPEVFKHSRAGTPGYEADTSDVVAHIRKVMNEPANLESPAVQESLGYVLKRLVDDKGNLKITNPEQLWGLRQQLDRMTGKRMRGEDSNLHYAAGQLNEIKPLLDAAIEPVAPGFADMLAAYKGHSQAIEGMRLLQDYRNSLYAGSGGNMRMTFEKVNKMMRDIVDARDPNLNRGVNPYQSLTEEQMAKLWALRDDLRRSASALELARTPGSDSVQNAWDLVKGLATGPEAEALLHGAVASMFGPAAPIVSGMGKRIVGPIMEGRTAAKRTARGMELLRPSNPLIPPNAPP